MTEPVKTLDEMQVGDTCVVMDETETPVLSTVVKATKLFLYAPPGIRKFRRKGGGEVGGYKCLRPATPEAIADAGAAKERLSQWADRRDLLHRAGILSRTGSIEAVRAVLAALRERVP